MPKTGKRPFVPDDRDLRLSSVLTAEAPTPPAGDLGHADLVKTWGMLGNDDAGDCVLAGGAHEVMLLGRIGGHNPAFSEASVISDYSAITGYDPEDPSTDRGTYVRDAMRYRRKTGLLDAHARRHRIGAFLQIDPKDTTKLYQALYIFGCVGIGIEFPDSASRQFNAHETWSVVKGAKVEGGHYVPVVARKDGQPVCVTWGRTQAMTEDFYAKYCDEAWCYLSASALGDDGETPEGLDREALKSALAELGR